MENYQKKIADEIKTAKLNGAKEVDFEIFDYLNSFNITDRTKDECLYTLERYMEILKIFKTLPLEYQQYFFDTYKISDNIDNQALESKEQFACFINGEITGDGAIDILINNYGKKLTKEILLTSHDMLLQYNEQSKLGFRESDTKFVGHFSNGERVIDYFPLQYKKIDEALNIFLNYYNAHINQFDHDYETLVRPIVYHGILAALQIFEDGNTRLSRVFQTVEIWGMINHLLDEKLELPFMYTTHQYIPYRGEYRSKIKNLVLKNDNEAWNDFIKFNLGRFQESLNLSEQNIEKVKMM